MTAHTEEYIDDLVPSGASFLVGGLKFRMQEFNRINARFQSSLLFVATVAILIPSAVAVAGRQS